MAQARRAFSLHRNSGQSGAGGSARDSGQPEAWQAVSVLPQGHEPAGEETQDLSAYLDILRRRKWQMLVPAAILFVIALFIAFTLPSVYRSTATILIEEQEIPPDLVRSTITSYADQRIQVISQQVMTRANLWQIVEKYDLYPDKRSREPSEAILEAMRKNIKLDLVSSEAQDKRSGAKTAATIAFTLSYDGDTPEKAQRVANELVSLYLSENVKSRQQKATDTSNFLAEEAKKRNERIGDLEAQLAQFKEKHIGSLPELQQVNMQLRERTDVELMDTERQIRAIEERRFYLEGQLAQTKPHTPIIAAGGERILDSDERLKVLEAQYAAASATYSNDHPDMVKMRREMAALEAQSGGTGGSLAAANQLARLRTDLATLREKYSGDHPDVVKTQRAIAALEASIARPAPETQVRAKNPENPAYIALKSQLEANNADLRSLAARRAELRNRLAQLEARLQETPRVEREYADLIRERETEVRRYQEIKAKQAEAQVAQELEKDRKGERFSLIDPPQVPEKPDRPNRKAIVLLGFILAFGGGLGYGALLETLDHSVRGSRGLAAILSAPLLATIPYIENAEDAQRRSRRRTITIAAVVGGIALAALLIHAFVIELDVFWYVLLRKLGVE